MILRFSKSKSYSFLLISTLFCFACQNKTEKKRELVNTMMDDGILSMYIPSSLFNKILAEDKDFGFYEYSYSYQVREQKNVNNTIQVRYELELEGGRPLGATHEVTTRLLVKEDHIKRFADNKKVISIDSIVHPDLRIGLINYSEGSGDTTIYTTLAFVPNHKRPWYEIYIKYDNSERGKMLKDSIPLILESISVK